MRLTVKFLLFTLKIIEAVLGQVKYNTTLWAAKNIVHLAVMEDIMEKEVLEILQEALWIQTKLMSKSKTCPGFYDEGLSAYGTLFTDPYFINQWYLHDCRADKNTPVADLNVIPVWYKYKIFGKGIVAILMDSIVETTHEDLIDNYDENYSMNLYEEDEYVEPNSGHGTLTAGVMAMRAGNKVCGVGIAPLITFGSVRKKKFKTSSTDLLRGINFARSIADIFLCPWSSGKGANNMNYLHPKEMFALRMGIEWGRQEKGIIYVFSSGNNGDVFDTCAYMEYVNSIYTIAAGSIDHYGHPSDIAEACSAIIVSCYGGSKKDADSLKITTTSLHNNCKVGKVLGSSLVVTLIGGFVALILEANPNLTWRGVQHVLVWTSEVAAIAHNLKWNRNKAGLYYHHYLGFGLINALGAVQLALKMQNEILPPMNTPIKFNKNNGLKIFLRCNGCRKSPSNVKYMEHVQLITSINYKRRGNLQILLTSPSKTVTQILNRRPGDESTDGFKKWVFDTTHLWAESPKGIWTIEIFDLESNAPANDISLDEGELLYLALVIHGTKLKPPHYAAARSYYHFKTSPDLVETKHVEPKSSKLSKLNIFHPFKKVMELWRN